MKRTTMAASAALALFALTGCSQAPEIESMYDLEAAYEAAGGDCSEAKAIDPTTLLIEATSMEICRYGDEGASLMIVFESADQKRSILIRSTAITYSSTVKSGRSVIWARKKHQICLGSAASATDP